MAAVLLSLTLTQKLLFIAKQERTFELQQYHIEQLQEMNKIIKTQRHDFVNHLQTVYGLMQLGEVEEAQSFISELYTEVQISGEILRLAIPELSALLLVKTGVATSRNISFKIEVSSDLSQIDVRPFDLVAIMGNLINNALEAVENIPVADRKVQFQVFENSGYFIMQTRNPSFIPKELRTMIFTPGFSTKSDSTDRGLGLASIKHLAETYNGFVVVSSHLDKGSCFTVGFPK
ncbi:MAG: histidine kinase [Firmicutes bacterium HGW-Firmicutes-15]|nr:MAG: histidine kinase [Firmicutes bacterium HGW-Firmicutes-15]